MEEDDGEDGVEENGGVQGCLSPFPLPFGGLYPSPSSPFEDIPPFGELELSPYILVLLSS